MDKTPAIPSLNPKGTWRTYTTDDGLASLQTEHIAEDAGGFLWIGTWDSGASRFDGVELKQELADLAPLHTDADRLNRVLMNLLSNAVKFTEQGSITVAVKPAEGGLELSVADTGIGIPPEDLPHIFEEFRQSGRRGEGEKQGSGLGLAIAKKSVELLGGSIEVESQVGKGTRFSLRLRDYGG